MDPITKPMSLDEIREALAPRMFDTVSFRIPGRNTNERVIGEYVGAADKDAHVIAYVYTDESGQRHVWSQLIVPVDDIEIEQRYWQG